MSTEHTHPTATASHNRAILLIAALVAVVVAAGATATSGHNGSTSTPTPPAFHLPPYVLMHGGAPVPDISVAAFPPGLRYDGGPDEGTRGPTDSSSR
jgi:hypothetical protein